MCVREAGERPAEYHRRSVALHPVVLANADATKFAARDVRGRGRGVVEGDELGDVCGRQPCPVVPAVATIIIQGLGPVRRVLGAVWGELHAELGGDNRAGWKRWVDWHVDDVAIVRRWEGW